MPLPKMPSGKASRLTDIAASLPLEGPTEQDKKTVRRARKNKTTELPKKEAALLKPVAAKEAVREVKAEMSKEAAAAKKEACAPVSHRRNKNIPDDGKKRLYVLDTNVLMHDPTSIFRFEEHDVYLPMITLEELDNHKSGMTDVARNVRQVSRTLDQIMQHLEGSMDRTVVLVSKDINIRLKAAALGLLAEDYYNDKMIEDCDLLYTGLLKLPANFWEQHGKDLKSWQKDGRTWYQIKGPMVRQFLINQFIWYEAPDATPFYGEVKSIEGDTAVVRVIDDYTNPKHQVWGINARNREQSFALNLLLDPEIDFVTLLGQAGTGKTLLTLAAALTQTMEMRRFNEIIITRATISVGEDIGFLPGTEEEKMAPWLGAIDDNLEVLNRGGNGTEWGRRASEDLIRSRIRIKSMSFMRGRTFLNKFVIIDEAQNLTPKQMKTLITRAGPGSKIVCLGNIAQIDTPYLTEGSSGLTYVVDRFKNWPHSGHITMQRGERSRLADYASEAL